MKTLCDSQGRHSYSFFFSAGKKTLKSKANRQTKTHLPQISQDALNTFDNEDESFSSGRQARISFISQRLSGSSGGGAERPTLKRFVVLNFIEQRRSADFCLPHNNIWLELPERKYAAQPRCSATAGLMNVSSSTLRWRAAHLLRLAAGGNRMCGLCAIDPLQYVVSRPELSDSDGFWLMKNNDSTPNKHMLRLQLRFYYRKMCQTLHSAMDVRRVFLFGLQIGTEHEPSSIHCLN